MPAKSVRAEGEVRVLEQMACACLRRHTEWSGCGMGGRPGLGGDATCVEGWARRFPMTKRMGAGYYLRRSEYELCE